MEKKYLKNITIEPIMCKNIDSKIKYLVSVKVILAVNEQILMTTFYDAKSLNPCFRIFSNQNDFLTYDYEKMKWSDATLDKRLNYTNTYCNDQIVRIRTDEMTYDDVDSMSCGSLYYRKADDTVTLLNAFQQQIRQERLDKKHEKKCAEINILMSQVQPLPIDIQSWVDKAPLKRSRYIYYKRKGKKIQGYCTACKNDVILSTAKHNNSDSCPICHSKIILKAEGISSSIFDHDHFDYVQKIEGGLMVRTFYVSKDYRADYRTPKYSYYEETRNVLVSGKKICGFVPNRNFSFYDSWKPYNGIMLYAYLYTENLNRVFKGTPWQYCAIQKYAQHMPKFSSVYYLNKYSKYQSLEYLVKMKLYRLVDEDQKNAFFYYSDAVHYNGGTVRDVLCISKEMLAVAQQANISSRELKFMQAVNASGKKITYTEIQLIRKNFGNCNLDTIASLLKYVPISKISSYLEKQNKVSTENINYGNTATDWYDYLKNANFIGYNMKSSILYPRDLKKEHDKVCALALIKQNDANKKTIIQMEKQLNERLGFLAMGFVIRAPQSVDEFIQEGEKLNHCVGTYVSDVANGNTIILFIRDEKEPEKPYFTVEIKNEEVRQIRGFDDCDPPSNVSNFLNEWKKKKLYAGAIKMKTA